MEPCTPSPLCPVITDTPAVLSTEPSMFLVRTSQIQTWEVPSWLGMGCRSPRQAWAWIDQEVVVLMGEC